MIAFNLPPRSANRGFLRRIGPIASLAGLLTACQAGGALYSGRSDDLPALSTAVANNNGTLKIADGYGGRLAETVEALEWLEQKKIPVQVIDRCASACTLLLGYESLCYSQKAEFWFHSARFEDGSASELGNAILRARYPGWLRNWLDENSGLSSDNGWTILHAEELATIEPQPRLCPAEQT